eukprot:TRINITY_DN2148_c0_g1_i3.p1 TRINITY_DN2148_c0_g1~~TRINITY_DN2148_c0_g1_i3.p1  ORF type:complete len:217 (-),score=44.54 TRINITY_DN2148_c0_g1_i3:363-1013(-)
MIRRPPRSTLSSSSAASDVYKRQRQSSESKQPLLDGMPLQRRRAKPVGEADVQDLRIEGAALGRSVAAEMPGELGDSPRHNQGVTNFMRIDGTGADILRLHSAVQLQANFRSDLDSILRLDSADDEPAEPRQLVVPACAEDAVCAETAADIMRIHTCEQGDSNLIWMVRNGEKQMRRADTASSEAPELLEGAAQELAEQALAKQEAQQVNIMKIHA